MRKPAAALTSLAWFAAVGGTFGTPAQPAAADATAGRVRCGRRRVLCCPARRRRGE
jgi:hypothetical protein